MDIIGSILTERLSAIKRLLEDYKKTIKSAADMGEKGDRGDR